MDLKVKRAFNKLVQEVSQYVQSFGGFDLDLYGLAPESIKNFDKLIMVVELAKDIIEYIHLNYTSNWNHYGYYFYQHADFMIEQVEILEPFARQQINNEEMDISEMLSMISHPKVLPDGIDYKKYNEIFNQLKLPSVMFHYIFVCENILRKFIIQVLDDNGYPSVDSIGNSNLSNNINIRKTQEANQNYLPMRGGHDIYYLDLIKLINIIRHVWNSCFEDKFKDKQWIFSRIDSLYTIRNRVAHNSGYLTSDELKSVETYCREIIKQIDQYIN